MYKTKIDWCDSSWNPATGCLHGCEYCYARRIAERFGGASETHNNETCHECQWITEAEGKIHELDKPIYDYDMVRNAPYPYVFDPTFHRYRLGQPAKWPKPRNIFVCSMADLFGKWVPDDWKIEVLEACAKAPQHNYLFLTKDPIGYDIWPTGKHKEFHDYEAYTENMWLGVTYTGRERLEGHYQEWEVGRPMDLWTNSWYLWRMSPNLLPANGAHRFISIEPLWCDICEVEDERDGGKLLEKFLLPRGYKSFFEWIIVGAETGNRKGRVVPEREWIEKLLELCRKAGVPLFMKDSLADIWGGPLIQEFPEGLRKGR